MHTKKVPQKGTVVCGGASSLCACVRITLPHQNPHCKAVVVPMKKNRVTAMLSAAAATMAVMVRPA
jgi:hypothetical protein